MYLIVRNVDNKIFKMAICALILNLCDPDIETLIRSIEKTNRKLINSQISLVFN